MSSKDLVRKFWDDQFPNQPSIDIEKMSGGGSERKYYRLFTEEKSYVVAHSEDSDENAEFLRFTDFLSRHGTRVAQILAVSDDISTYALEDLGDDTLLSVATSDETSEAELRDIYRQTIDELYSAQTALGPIATELPTYSYELVLHDLMYFLYDFVKVSGLNFEPEKTLHGLTDWAADISQFHVTGFMYRDFQGRNVMVKNGQPYLLDYQGGMLGPVAYDMSSLLYQAKAGLSPELRAELWNYYKSLITASSDIDSGELEQDYQYTTLLRLLQVLGAYGYLGLVQGKEHFTSSIYPALHNLKEYLSAESVYIPEGLMQVLQEITSDDYMKKYKHKK